MTDNIFLNTGYETKNEVTVRDFLKYVADIDNQFFAIEDSRWDSAYSAKHMMEMWQEAYGILRMYQPDLGQRIYYLSTTKEMWKSRNGWEGYCLVDISGNILVSFTLSVS